MRLPLAVCTAVLALAAPHVAFGAEDPFALMDADKDGRITAAEHAAGARAMFVAMDGDKDGKVTAAEMDAAQPKGAGKKPKGGAMSSADKIKVVDADRDGVLSAQEHEAARRRCSPGWTATGMAR